MPTQRLELTWIGKNNPEYDIANIEPRILIEDPEKSHGDPTSENMLIHGDNLLALKALLPEYEGKIKCIYIDPPYNTGNAFEHYDDSVEHSTWLSLMKPRLELLKMLLSENGVIFVQIDKNEWAYLKVLLDEVFWRDAYITTVCVRMSITSWYKIEHSDKTIVKNSEYIHAYGRNFKVKPAYEATEYDSHYSYILRWNNTKWLYEMFPLIEEPSVASELIKFWLTKSSKNLEVLYKLSNVFKEYVYENRNLIWRTHTAPADALNSKETILPQLITEKHVIEFFAKSWDKYYIKKTSTGLNQYIPIWLKFNIVDSYDGISETLSNILWDSWNDFYLDMWNVENEWSIEFKASKKPERLIYRIFNMFTEPNDIVLDSFLWSWTTAAVAHKMWRKYIGIEMWNHAYTHCKVRLDKVINWEDENWITKFVEWKWGGGYKFYELAPSFITLDEFGNRIIDEFYNDSKLVRAMCKLINYTFKPSQTEYFKQGLWTGHNYLFVTTQTLSIGLVRQIVSHLGTNESLVICPKKYEAGAESVDPRITIKKIPQSILKACQYGKKDYLLPIRENTLEEIEDEEDESN